MKEKIIELQNYMRANYPMLHHGGCWVFTLAFKNVMWGTVVVKKRHTYNRYKGMTLDWFGIYDTVGTSEPVKDFEKYYEEAERNPMFFKNEGIVYRSKGSICIGRYCSNPVSSLR